MNFSKRENFYLFFRELFYALFGSLIVFSLLEVFWPRIVISRINLNLVLLVWLAVGIVLLSISKKD